MLGLITFCILFLSGALAASGTAKLLMMLISPGEMLGAWQKVLSCIEPGKGDRYYSLREFWYKRLGGCGVCMRQFIAELSFVVICMLYSAEGSFPTEAIDNALLRWMANVAVFIGYCGTALQIGQWLEYKGKESNDGEKIIETIYRKN